MTIYRGRSITSEEIELPPMKRKVRNRLAEHARPAAVIADNRPVSGPLGTITPLEYVQVRRTPDEPLFKSLMEQYHYLGYEQPVGSAAFCCTSSSL